MFINNQTAQQNVSYNRDCGIVPDSLQTCEDYLCLRANLQNIMRIGEPTCMCQVNFTLDDDMDTPVYMYYSLHNYFQNHRRCALIVLQQDATCVYTQVCQFLEW